MIRWLDEGIVLSARPLGERRLIATLLTQEHGIHRGVFRATKATQSLLEPGTHVSCRWFARLEEQLGTWTLEPIYSPIAYVLNQRRALTALNAATSLSLACLPEREAAPRVFAALLNLVTHFHDATLWPALYVLFEIMVLEHAGIRLDLARCAATGSTNDLIYVSPRTGRAVSREAGIPYQDKLLPLPAFLTLGSDLKTIAMQDILAGLALTGYFLSGVVLGPHDLEMPPARHRLLKELQRECPSTTK